MPAGSDLVRTRRNGLGPLAPVRAAVPSAISHGMRKPEKDPKRANLHTPKAAYYVTRR